MTDGGDKDGGSQHLYPRVLLKISGESLMGQQAYGIDPEMVATVAREVRDVIASGVETCLVIGGGNIFRGVSGAAAGMERATGDYMGMLATVMNALAMQNALEMLDVPTRVMSAFRSARCASPISAAGPCATLKRGVLSFSLPVLVSRSSRLTPQRRFVPPRWGVRRY